MLLATYWYVGHCVYDIIMGNMVDNWDDVAVIFSNKWENSSGCKSRLFG